MFGYKSYKPDYEYLCRMIGIDKFKDIFEPALLQEILQKGKVMEFKAGSVIIELGQHIRMIPLILEGNIKVTRTDEGGSEILLYYVNPQESCAMTFSCCMTLHASEIRAVAEDDVRLLALPSYVMDEWTKKYDSWRNFIMRTMYSRFNELLKTIDQIAFQKLDDRLVNYLKTKTKTHNSKVLNLSHQQIADDLATSRVVISRLLKKLENSKKLLLYRNQIKVLSGL